MAESVISVMKAQRRWLIASPDKKPFYINGQMRNGVLDSPADTEQLASYDDASAVLAARGDGWHLGFALGPDGTGGHWQGIDFDKVRANQIGDVADAVPGYVEFSPSGAGAHAIGYGRHFVTLGSRPCENAGAEVLSSELISKHIGESRVRHGHYVAMALRIALLPMMLSTLVKL